MPKGGFWTNKENLKYDPKSQFRFMVKIDGFRLEDAEGTVGVGAKGDYANDAPNDTDIVWYAKSIDKPKFSITDVYGEQGWRSFRNPDQAEYQPRVDAPVWSPVTMKLIDPSYPAATRKLLRWLRRSGYHDDLMAGALNSLDLSPDEALYRSVGAVSIVQLGSNTITRAGGSKEALELERWTLVNAYPAEVDFGSLDYSSDEFVELTIKWKYETCFVDCINYPTGEETEQMFRYFANYPISQKGIPSIGGSVVESRTNREVGEREEDDPSPEVVPDQVPSEVDAAEAIGAAVQTSLGDLGESPVDGASMSIQVDGDFGDIFGPQSTY